MRGNLLSRCPNALREMRGRKKQHDYLYEEIFVNKIYFRHGIGLPEDACVFDVGANIGMFTMFVNLNAPQASVYSFEPLGPSFEALRLNAKLYAANAKVFNIGMAESDREETFIFYPRHTMMSGIRAYAKPEEELEVVKRWLLNAQEKGSGGMAEAVEQADEILAGRYEGESHICRLRRVSDVIREHGIQRIDLLKVDVQRAELDVLRGIEE